jgi:hypothetical protein
MALFGIYRVVDVESKTKRGTPTTLLHIENPTNGKTFCGLKPWGISQKLFIPAWDCTACYERAERKAGKNPLMIKPAE